MKLTNANPLQALLIGRDDWLMWFLPSILSRAGYTVDVITSSPLMKSCRFVRHCEIIPASTSIVALAAQRCRNPYDWIIITEDQILSDIVHGNLPTETKLKLLPIIKEENFGMVQKRQKTGNTRQSKVRPLSGSFSHKYY